MSFAATQVLAALYCCNCSQELPDVHANDHQAAHLLQNAINSWAYGSPRSLIITLQHFMRVYEAVHGGPAAAAAAASDGVDLSTLAGVMHVSSATLLVKMLQDRLAATTLPDGISNVLDMM
jgi:hypothetical protein